MISVTEGFAASKVKLQIEDFHLDLDPDIWEILSRPVPRWTVSPSLQSNLPGSCKAAAAFFHREGREQHLAS